MSNKTEKHQGQTYLVFFGFLFLAINICHLSFDI